MQVCVVGMDAGGTKTRVCILDENCRLVGQGVGGPANPNFAPPEVVMASIRQAAESARASAGPAGRRVALVAVGGPTSATYYEPILREVFGNPDLLAAGEGPITLAAGSRSEFGGVIVAGTGSMAWGRNRRGEAILVGGWGALLGDEGSAYDIAIAALRAACRCADGRGTPTTLLPRYLSHLGFREMREIIRPIYHGELDRRAIAATCPLVFEAARAGDRVAQTILRRAGRELALGAVTCARALSMLDDEFDVVASGGVFRGGDFVLPAARRHLARYCPGARLVLPTYEPAIGAALVALRKLGRQLDDAAYSRLGESVARLAAPA